MDFALDPPSAALAAAGCAAFDVAAAQALNADAQVVPLDAPARAHVLDEIRGRSR